VTEAVQEAVRMTNAYWQLGIPSIPPSEKRAEQNLQQQQAATTIEINNQRPIAGSIETVN